MSISPLPTPLQQLGARRFSFYPPILNVEHNEWVFRRASWSDIVAVNTRSGEEACIPRMFLGEVSIIDHPVVIVGLVRELEWNQGAVAPHRRPVIELPVAVNDNRVSVSHPHRLAPVVNIRLEAPHESRKGKKIAVAAMLGAMACLIAADLIRQMQTHQRSEYSAVVRRFGRPALDRQLSGSRRVLFWPGRHLRVVLDPQGRILDSATLPHGANTADVLQSVPAF